MTELNPVPRNLRFKPSSNTTWLRAGGARFFAAAQVNPAGWPAGVAAAEADQVGLKQVTDPDTFVELRSRPESAFSWKGRYGLNTAVVPAGSGTAVQLRQNPAVRASAAA